MGKLQNSIRTKRHLQPPVHSPLVLACSNHWQNVDKVRERILPHVEFEYRYGVGHEEVTYTVAKGCETLRKC